MATKTVTVCDVVVRRNPCGEPATNKVEIKLNGKRHGTGDICDTHVATLDESMSKLGLGSVASQPSKKSSSRSKGPKTFKAASGARFTAKDARSWLIEQGELEEGSTGIIAKDKIKLYADAH